MSKRHWQNLIVLCVLLPLYYVQLAHHTNWRDEFNAWSIAAISQSLGEVLHRVHYEAHPALWYVLCYGASRISTAGWMFKVLEGTVGTAIFASLAFLTPFVWWELALVLGGFYVSFHFTVLCRMYSLELLVALLYTWARLRWPERPVRNALWLALLVNTEVTGGLLACGFLMEMAISRTQAARAEGRSSVKELLQALGVFLLGCAVSIAGLWPAKDIGWSATGRLFAQAFTGEHIGSSFGKWTGLAFFPTSTNTQNLWVDPELKPHAILIPIALVLLIMTYRKYPRYAAMFLATAFAGMVFGDITNVSGVRHYGVEAVMLICTVWMMRSEKVVPPKAAYALLGLLVIATLHNLKLQYGRPYADDDDAANWMRAQGLVDVPMMGTPDTSIVGVPERLHRPVFQLDCMCWDRVMTFASRRDKFRWDLDTAPNFIKATELLGGTITYLSNRPLRSEEVSQIEHAGIRLQLMKSFTRGYVDDEYYYIYRVEAPQR